MTKRKEITVVTPYLHENFLVMALDRQWVEVFWGTIPTFTVIIDEIGRLVLIGPIVSRVKNGGTKL